MKSLTLSYRTADKVEVRLAEIHDDTLFRMAAVAAVENAEREANSVGRTDAILGRLKMLEVARLAAALDLIAPGFETMRSSAGEATDPCKHLM